MAHYVHNNIQFKLDPPPVVQTNVDFQLGPYALSRFGFNIPVIANSIPLHREAPNAKSKLVMAHFDTGAVITCIDEKLADELELLPIGVSTIQTANGPKDVKQYVIDVSFPGTGLKGYCLSVNSCSLAYKPEFGNADPTNFALLIGRDVMAHWNIVWNGPTSTVIISD